MASKIQVVDCKNCDCKDSTCIYVPNEPWAETDNAWRFLVKTISFDAWSSGFWFPKKKCQLTPIDKQKQILKMPNWLYDKLIITIK